MNIEEYANNIKFKFVQPSTPLIQLSVREQIMNTILPDKEEEYRNLFYELCNIPKMSTFALATIINKAVSELKEDEVFVNVGVWCGFTFLSGLLNNPEKKCIGIDNFSEFDFSEGNHLVKLSPKLEFTNNFENCKSENHFFYNMDYIDYFNTEHKDKIGFYIYDGEHSYENQLKGLEIAEPFFSNNCIILVDDTNMTEAKQATLDFMGKSKHNYKIIFDKNTFSNAHPTFWNGIMIIQKIN